ncbi:hypothetical protein CEP54_016050 [Fusarium duplospermum]|uniref:Uncharacterized protein n=1 Tax=Fusarium duplospermum TaxID=1325734 RepID=A0A428NIR3_9HYPO|nr:hypothetical protein CEP54_016050 [Fusarium duplospermum]
MKQKWLSLDAPRGWAVYSLDSSGRPDLELPPPEELYRIFTADEVEAMEEHGGYANYRLPSLEEALIRTEDPTEGNTPIHVLGQILLHPALTTLHLYGVSLLQNSIMNFKFPNELCNLEHLDLTESLFDHSSLKIILARCKKPKWLSTESAGERRHEF